MRENNFQAKEGGRQGIQCCDRLDGFGIGKDPPILSTWVRLSELASAEAMRVAIRRVRALVRRNGPTFSSSPSIFVWPGSPSAEGRQILRAAGDWVRLRGGHRRGKLRGRRRPVREREGGGESAVLDGLLQGMGYLDRLG
jgi:hypothetical protein